MIMMNMIMMIIARAASGELIQATVVILWNGLSENKKWPCRMCCGAWLLVFSTGTPLKNASR